MSTPIFPAVGPDNKIQGRHLPDRLSDTALTQKIQQEAGEGFVQVIPGKNLIDPAQITHDVYVHSSGQLFNAAGFYVTEYIPVKAGVTYVVNYARGLAFYNSTTREYISGTYETMNDGEYTFTPPEDRLFRVTARAANGSTWQMEIGDTPTVYEPYQKVIAPVGIPSEYLTPKDGEQYFSRDGDSLQAVTTLDGKTLEINASLTGNSGGIFDWKDVRHDGILISNSPDDVAPVITQQYTIGGNHGFVSAVYWPPGGHDKTRADLGSRWQDGGGYEYALLQLRDDGTLLAARKYLIDPDGTKSMVWALPTTSLTHVSGATHTADLAPPTDRMEMRPAWQRARHRVTIDGVDFHGGEMVSGAQMRIQESYDILDFADIYDSMTSHIGTPYEEMDIAAAMRLESDWRINPHGKIDGDFHLTEVQPTRLGRWAGLHAITSSKTPKLWVPGVKPINGLDWSAGVDRTELTESAYVTVDDLHDPTQPPTVRIDVGENLAVAIGVDPTYGAGTPEARLASIPDQLWYLANTGKIYPRVAGNQGPGWGRVSIRGIRHYLTPQEAADALAYPTDTRQAWASLATKSHEEITPRPFSADQKYSGRGFPEGKVSAPVGSVYTDTAATSGAIRWIKTSGIGTSGWEVEYGDTGNRRVDELFPQLSFEPEGAHGVYIRRIGYIVTLTARGISTVSGTISSSGLGAKFGAPEALWIPTLGRAKVGSTWTDVGNLHDRNEINTGSQAGVGDRVELSVTYTTYGNWPTTLS